MAYTNFQHCTEQEYTEILYSQGSENKLKIVFNGVELEDADRYCEKLTLKSRILPDDSSKRLSLDNFVSKEIELILHRLPDASVIQDQVEISIGTLVESSSLGDTYEYVPLGIFNIQDTPTTDKDKITIKLRDNRVKFDFNYNAKPLIDENEGSLTKLQILEDICEQAGVDTDIESFLGDNDVVGIYDNTITATSYISYLAEQAGCIASIDRDGKLIFVNINGEETEARGINITLTNINGTKFNEAKLYGNTEQEPLLPSEYQQVEYIQSSGTQYIDTGFKPNNNSRMVTKVNLVQQVGDYDNIGGARDGGNNQFHIVINYASPSSFDIRYGTQSRYYNTTITGLHTIDFNKTSCTIDGTTQTFNSATFTSNYNAYVFAVNNAGTASQKSNYKLYYLKWYDNGTLVRDYVPCYRKSDNEIGLYDLVNKVFYTNNGTGTFTKSNNIGPSPDYPQEIETVTGRQEISVSGKNLYNYDNRPTETKNVVTCTNNNDGTFTFNGTASTNTQFPLKSTFFLMSYLNGKTIQPFITGDNLQMFVAYYDANGTYQDMAQITNNGLYFDNNYYSANIYFYVGNGKTVTNAIGKPMLELGDTTSEYESYKGGNYEINLGKNLFITPESKTINGVTFTKNNDGTYNISGTATANANLDIDEYVYSTKIVKGDTYTLSANKNLPSGLNVYVESYNENTWKNHTIGNFLNSSRSKVTGSADYTDSNIIKYTIRVLNGNTVNIQNLGIQLEKGSQVTTYSAYKIPIELCKIGTYQDYIYKSNGVWYKHKAIGKFILNGTEDWNNDGGTIGTDYRHNIQVSKLNIGTPINTNYLYKSNYFYAINIGRNNVELGGFYLSSSWLVFDDKNATISSTNNWKTWLSSHNTEIYYVLATPVEEEIKDEELINQLENLSNAKLVKDKTIISVSSSDSISELYIKYYENKETIKIPLSIVEKYDKDKSFTVDRVVYEDAIRKYQTSNDETLDTLFINSANPYISTQKQLEDIHNIIGTIKVDSVTTGKILGNPAIDSYDIIEVYDDYQNDETVFKTIANHTLRYNGILIAEYKTQIGLEARTENVTVNGEPTFRKWAKTSIDNINAEVTIQAGEIQDTQNNLENNYYTKGSVDTLIINSATGVTNTFSEAGGNNVFRNTGLWFGPDTTTEEKEASSTDGKIEIDDGADNTLSDLKLYGNTEQETTTGKNLLKSYIATTTTNGVTISYDKSTQILTLNGTATANDTSFVFSGNSIPLDANTNYYFVAKYISGTAPTSNFRFEMYTSGWANYKSVSLYNMTSDINSTITTTSDLTYVIFRLRADNGNVFNNLKIKLYLSKVDNVYEPYTNGPSPNPDYPSEVETVTGRQEISVSGKNLFDATKCVAGYINNSNGAYATGGVSNFTTSSGIISFTATTAWRGAVSDYIQIDSTKTYTFKCERNLTSTWCNAYFYDSSKTFINYAGGGSTQFSFTNIPSNAVYCRIILQCSGSGSLNQTLTFSNIQLEQNTTPTEYEAFKGGSYEINLGKNLFDKSKVTRQGYQSGVAGATATRISSTTRLLSEDITAKGNTTYTFTLGTTKTLRYNIFELDKDDVILKVTATTTNVNSTLTTLSNTKKITVMLLWQTTTNAITLDDISDCNIQLEKGSQATTYSEYFTPIELCKIGTYQDYIYKSNGTWYKHKAIGKIVLDGSETWVQGNPNFRYYTDRIGQAITTATPISNYFKGGVYSYGVIIQNSNATTMRINLYYDSITGDYQALKTWLSTHNTEVYYVLATPVEEEITDTELISQLESIKTIDGYNLILLASNDVYTEFDITYLIDFTSYEYWTGDLGKMKEEKAGNLNALLLQHGTVYQEQQVPNGNYTISFKYKKLINLANVKCIINDVEYELTETDDTEFTQTIDVSTQHIRVTFTSDRQNACEIYDLMVNAGTVKLAYSQNQNETTTDTVNISKGITITSSNTDTTFKANADGIRTLDRNGNELTKFTDIGMTTKKMIVEDTSQIVGVLVQQVGDQTWFTKL